MFGDTVIFLWWLCLKDVNLFELQKGGPYLAIYLWGFMLVLSLVMMTLYPILIAPLFNKFTPVSFKYSFGPLQLKNSIQFHIKFSDNLIWYVVLNSFQKENSGWKLRILLPPSSFHWRSCLLSMDLQGQAIAMWGLFFCI